MSSQIVSVVLAGVGGQGILLASEIIAQAAMNAGFDVKTNEVHGMAQRGGSVIGQIRYGKEVYSPIIAKGTAQVLCALEQSEALRYADYLAAGALAVVNAQQIIPVTVSMGAAKYPDNVEQKLRDQYGRLIYFDASKKAVELGNIRTANVVLLGALSTGLDLPLEAWHKAIASCVKSQYVELNLKAFEEGRKMV
ncbi:MAG TPA: indolepyruvate oxidoreductase subunit beta [Anaerohalosphaeraceae bacterium]|nr:indolepyruvate oxidoreductase subunit beta [Anaerohalosphaeraceae bacterium]